MGNISLLEFQHDFSPREEELLDWARALKIYIGSGDKRHLPHGVTLENYRHSSTPCPLSKPFEGVK